MPNARFVAIQFSTALAATLVVSVTSADSAIYRCEVKGVMTYTDRPCGESSAVYVPDVTRVSTYDAHAISKAAASTARVRPARRTAQSESIAAAQAKHAQACARIDSSLHEIRARMRAGYDVQQGERLKERYSKLNARRRAQRC